MNTMNDILAVKECGNAAINPTFTADGSTPSVSHGRTLEVPPALSTTSTISAKHPGNTLTGAPGNRWNNTDGSGTECGHSLLNGTMALHSKLLAPPSTRIPESAWCV